MSKLTFKVDRMTKIQVTTSSKCITSVDVDAKTKEVHCKDGTVITVKLPNEPKSFIVEDEIDGV